MSCPVTLHLASPHTIAAQYNLSTYTTASERTRYHKQHLSLMARVGLRAILTSCYGYSLQDCTITTHKSGKPYLIGGAHYFSISHCQNMIAIAISRHHALGVDIEPCARKPTKQWERIIKKYKLADAQLTQQEFLYHWTRAEALAKLREVSVFSCLGKLPYPHETIISETVCDTGDWQNITITGGVQSATVLPPSNNDDRYVVSVASRLKNQP